MSRVAILSRRLELGLDVRRTDGVPAGVERRGLGPELEGVSEQRLRTEYPHSLAPCLHESLRVLVEGRFDEAERQRLALQVRARELTDHLARAAHDGRPEPVVLAHHLRRREL